MLVVRLNNCFNLYHQAFKRCAVLLYCMSALLCSISAIAATESVKVSVYQVWRGPSEGTLPSDPLVQLMAQDPTIQVEEWSGITLPGAAGRTPLMLSIAGQTAPDVFLSWFHIIRNDIAQGFCYPLNEWVGEDANTNGYVDAEEASWAGWKEIPPLWQQVATQEGKVYGLPVASTSHLSIVYRVDLVRQAGLDPNHPPKTWDEFLYWCQRLTLPKKQITGASLQRGQHGFALPPYGFTWLPWLQSTGGSPVIQVKVSPKTGKRYTFPMEATEFRTPDTGEDLTNVPSIWQADIASTAGQRAMGFYHRLRWQRWIRDPKTKEPVNLTPAQAKAGKATLPFGRTVRFRPDDVIVGCVRPLTGVESARLDENEWIGRGEVAMIEWFSDDLTRYAEDSGVNPELLGVFAIPAGPGGMPTVQAQRHYAVLGEGVRLRSKREREAIWRVLTTLTSSEAYDETVRRKVMSGKARFVNPRDLERLGFKDYLNEIPSSIRQFYHDIDTGAIQLRTEPFMGYWVSLEQALKTNVISMITSQDGENFNYTRALKELEYSSNNGAMFSRNPEQLRPFRPVAWIIFLLVAGIVVFFTGLIVKANMTEQKQRKPQGQAGIYSTWLPWLMLIPAIGLITMWGYYPLLRGMGMAFQDYHIVGKSAWVGLDNFINIFLDPDFYISVLQTVKFVGLNLLLVFISPIILALLLAEIPYGKVFWRSVFFLPQLTSGLVIALLWKLLYDSTESGLLNQFVGLFGMKPQDWLGNPGTAMLATIIPSVWAGMGISSLIYLAALKGIPDELYEAAALDGAGLLAKLWRITIPQLMPLIIINFIGAFIATFQGMGNIFLLTFGGPGKETMVLGMKIWLEAYNNLRFSTATAIAWVLGSALIGFAYLQIRILRKVEFRRVEEV